MNLNHIMIDSIFNYNFNFKHLLTMKDTIIWRNCSNLTIIIKSKINKLILENCENIEIIMSDALIGVEFSKCKDINLKIRKNKHINCFESFKSTVKLYIYKKEKRRITFFSENSKLIFIKN